MNNDVIFVCGYVGSLMGISVLIFIISVNGYIHTFVDISVCNTFVGMSVL